MILVKPIPMKHYFWMALAVSFLAAGVIYSYIDMAQILLDVTAPQSYFYVEISVIILNLHIVAWMSLLSLGTLGFGMAFNRFKALRTAQNIIVISLLYSIIPLCCLIYLANGSVHATKGNEIRYAITQYGMNQQASESLDLLQKRYKCCGAVNLSDYAFRDTTHCDLPIDGWKCFIPDSCLDEQGRPGFSQLSIWETEKNCPRKSFEEVLTVASYVVNFQGHGRMNNVKVEKGENQIFLNLKGCKNHLVNEYIRLLETVSSHNFLLCICQVATLLMNLWITHYMKHRARILEVVENRDVRDAFDYPPKY